jgi:16S rRNA (guanine527-N7)-methyltransferase
MFIIEIIMVESFKPKKYFSQITSRSFAELIKTIQLTKHLLEENGRYLLMKGSNIHEEDVDNFNVKVHSMTVPFVSEKRSLLEIQL